MPADLEARVAALIGVPAQLEGLLADSSFGTLYRVRLADGRAAVAKLYPPALRRITGVSEADQLRFLAERQVPVPHVFGAEPGLLVMALIAAGSGSAQADLGAVVAHLHTQTGQHYGFHDSTAFADFAQDNRALAPWPAYWRERRLLPMLRATRGSGHLPKDLDRRLDRLAQRLEDFLPAEPTAALLHGDLWQGNILTRSGAVAALIDPALSYGQAEIDLAMLCLFGAPSPAFYDAYGPVDPGFFKERRALYQTYPILFHIKAFGAGYLAPLAEALDILRI